jgi:DNA-binding CsgD family transcriptional regulator
MRLPEWDDPDKRDEALVRVAIRLGRADPLSAHEVAVVFLASHGVPRAKAAEWLHLSDWTVKDHRESARQKLGASTLPHAVATALRLGLIS